MYKLLILNLLGNFIIYLDKEDFELYKKKRKIEFLDYY